MRIQTRLFLVTGALVLALVGVQWWLHARQLRAIEAQLGEVATTVGAGLITGDPRLIVERLSFDAEDDEAPFWVTASVDIESDEHHVVALGSGEEAIIERRSLGSDEAADHESRSKRLVSRGTADQEAFDGQDVLLTEDEDRVVALVGSARPGQSLVELVEPERGGASYEWRVTEQRVNGAEGGSVRVLTRIDRRKKVVELGAEVESEAGGQEDHDEPSPRHSVRRIRLEVEEGDQRFERFLVIHADQDEAQRIPLPFSPVVRSSELNLRHGLTASAGLLLVGLAASGLLSRRLARPLELLAQRSEEIGRGELGQQVQVTASGEVGELQRAFNRMSERLAVLESERELWRRREHLAELGDLSRGLAHTLRNPLHTLGLVVDEMADESSGKRELAITARGQIQRIDRWLRSFLAIGAGGAATREQIELFDLVEGVVLEAVQQGAAVGLETCGQAARVLGVPGALRSALTNLIDNAVQASPEGAAVEVATRFDAERAEIMIRDRGPGLPEEVRARLYSPHVTTKVGGSGMGLFLARQLIVGMHHGALHIEDAEGGGTLVRVILERHRRGTLDGEPASMVGRGGSEAAPGGRDGCRVLEASTGPAGDEA